MIYIYKENPKLSPRLLYPILSHMAEPDLVQDVLKPQSGFCLYCVQGREPFHLEIEWISLKHCEIIRCMLKIINTTIILHVSIANSQAKNTKKTMSEHFSALILVSGLVFGFISFNYVQAKYVRCLDAELGKVVFSTKDLLLGLKKIGKNGLFHFFRSGPPPLMVNSLFKIFIKPFIYLLYFL